MGRAATSFSRKPLRGTTRERPDREASHLGDAGQFRRFLETLAAIIQRPITDLAAAERELNDLAKSG